jgi:hypothetical protein
VVLVGQQREREPLALVELLDALDRVGRDTEHDGADVVEVGDRVAQPARLRRAARRVGLGVEVEHDGPAGEVGQRDVVAVLVGEHELRRPLAGLDHPVLLISEAATAAGP